MIVQVVTHEHANADNKPNSPKVVFLKTNIPELPYTLKFKELKLSCGQTLVQNKN